MHRYTSLIPWLFVAACYQSQLVVPEDASEQDTGDQDLGALDAITSADTDQDTELVTRDTGDPGADDTATFDTSTEDAMDDTVAADTAVDTAVTDTGSEDTGTTIAPICRSDGRYGIDVTARELSDFDGHAAWLSVSEPESIDGGDWDLRVLQAGTIVGGEVHFSCASSLTGAAGFPSLAVTIDVDDSGGCSAGDLWMAEEFARWTADLTYLIDSAGLDDPPEGVEQRMGSWRPVSTSIYDGHPYCTFFFSMP